MTAKRLAVVVGVVAAALFMAAPAVATHVFRDVPDDHPHAAGIHWAAEAGLVIGFPDGTFRPAGGVNRGQLATILQRQNAFRGPVYTLTPLCGSLRFSVVDHNRRGSGVASVEYSVDGGTRTALGAIPADGELVFDASETGLVTLFVDDIAWATVPSAEDCRTAP